GCGAREPIPPIGETPMSHEARGCGREIVDNRFGVNLARRAAMLDSMRRSIKSQCLTAWERRQRLASIPNPVQRRVEEVTLDQLDENNNSSLPVLMGEILRHNADCEAVEERQYMVKG